MDFEDSKNIIRTMYKKNLDRLLHECELEPKLFRHPFTGIPKTLNPFFVGVKDIVGLLHNTLIAGGPCLDHCNSNPKMIRANVLIDLLYPIQIAALNDVDCCIYLFIPDKSWLLDISQNMLSSWRDVGDRMERLARFISMKIGFKKLHFIRTDKPSTSLLLEKWAKRIGEMIDEDVLDNLYSVGSGSHMVKKGLEPWLRQLYTKNIVSYIPGFLAESLNFRRECVVVVENIQQARAVAAARKLNRMTAWQGSISCLTYLTPPSLSARSRMSRSTGGAFCIEQTEAEWRLLLASAEPVARKYWLSSCARDWLAAFSANDSIELLHRLGMKILE